MYIYTIGDPEDLRRTLLAAKSTLENEFGGWSKTEGHSARLERLIDECERHLREKETDVPLEYAVLCTKPGQNDLLLHCPTAGQAATTAGAINEDSTDVTAVVVARPQAGWAPL